MNFKILSVLGTLLLSQLAWGKIPQLKDISYRVECQIEKNELIFDLYNDDNVKLGFFWVDGVSYPATQLVESEKSIRIPYKVKVFGPFKSERSVTLVKENIVAAEKFKVRGSKSRGYCIAYNSGLGDYMSGLNSKIQWHGQSDVVKPYCENLERIMNSEQVSEVKPRIVEISEMVLERYCSQN